MEGTAGKSSSLWFKSINVYNCCFKSDLFLNKKIVRILLCFEDERKCAQSWLAVAGFKKIIKNPRSKISVMLVEKRLFLLSLFVDLLL